MGRMSADYWREYRRRRGDELRAYQREYQERRRRYELTDEDVERKIAYHRKWLDSYIKERELRAKRRAA